MTRLFLVLSLFTLAPHAQAGSLFRPTQLDTPEIQQLEHRRKTFKTRGIALTVTAPIIMSSGYFVSALGVTFAVAGRSSEFWPGIGIALGGAAFFAAGTYMLVQGTYDLVAASAHKKLIKRLRMKEEALARRNNGRENIQHSEELTDVCDKDSLVEYL